MGFSNKMCKKKTGKPYIVHEMQKEQIFDLKRLALDVGQNFKTNLNGENVSWNSIKFQNDKSGK